jgi:hypothetical protein
VAFLAGVPAHLELKFTDKYLSEREEIFEEKLESEIKDEILWKVNFDVSLKDT